MLRKQVLYIAAAAMLSMLGVVQHAQAADATAGIDFASAYVFRGVAINDNWVAQPTLDVGTDFGLSLGTWANFDMETGSGGSPKGGQFSEIDYYASYELPLGLDCYSLSVGYTEYTYPRSTADADREVNIMNSFDVLLQPALNVYIGLDGYIQKQVLLEGTIGHEFELTEDLVFGIDGAVTYLWQGDDADLAGADDGFSYAQLNYGFAWKWFHLTGSSIFETDDKVTVVDEKFVGMLGVSVDF